MEKQERKRRVVTGILIAAGICMCILGSLGGEAQIVLTKAANICMECIGLG